MVKQPPKMTALVVSAIRNLRDVQGSTPREILNYILAEYNTANNDSAIQRKLTTALKRGLEYGILKQSHGYYSLNTEPEAINPVDGMLEPVEKAACGCKGAGRSRRRKARRSGGGCKSRRSRKSRKSRSKRSRCGASRKRRSRRSGRSRGGCKSKSSRRRSRRGRSGKGCGGKKRRAKRSARRAGCRPKPKRCSGRRGDDVDMLAKDPIEITRRRENLIDDGYVYDREDRRSQSRGRQSTGSRSRTPSRGRSSGSSDHEENDGNRRDRLVE